MLFTRRADHLRTHPGQITFPGGRADKTDTGPVATALRETEEEIGLASSSIKAVGFLDTFETFTGFLVTPVVGLITPGFQLHPNPFEVAETMEIPLSFLLDPANYRTSSRAMGDARYHFYTLEYGEHVIWGATAGMLVNFYQRMISRS